MPLLQKFRWAGNHRFIYDNQKEAEDKALSLSTVYLFGTQVIQYDGKYCVENWVSQFVKPEIIVAVYLNGVKQ